MASQATTQSRRRAGTSFDGSVDVIETLPGVPSHSPTRSACTVADTGSRSSESVTTSTRMPKRVPSSSLIPATRSKGLPPTSRSTSRSTSLAEVASPAPPNQTRVGFGRHSVRARHAPARDWPRWPRAVQIRPRSTRFLAATIAAKLLPRTTRGPCRFPGKGL